MMRTDLTELHGKLSLCWGSMEGVACADFLAAAAGAGFQAITLNSAMFEDVIGACNSEADFQRMLEAHNLRVSNIDPLFNWLPSSVQLPGDDLINRCTRASAEQIFHIAHVCGTDLVNAPLGLATPQSEQEIIDHFADLCERAAREELRVSLEFMPFNQVPDLATAARIVQQAGCANGGIMFDCWHHHRGGGTPDDIMKVPADKYFALQMDDALPDPMEDMLEETLNHRLLPGEGCIDLVQTLGTLKKHGAELIYDVEVFKAPLRSKAPKERARMLFDSAQAIVRSI